jgi:hypothetical protein
MHLLHEICQQFNLQIIGLIPIGPGGGNPEVTFRGSNNDVMDMLRWYHQESEEDAADYYDEYSFEDTPRPFEVEAKKDPRFMSGDRKYVDLSGRSKGM